MFSRPSSPRRMLPRCALLASALLFAAACGGDGGGGGGGNGAGLNGASLTVGGKEFTEQQVLCQITILALEDAGADVTDKCGLHGSDTTRRALTSGEIDMYWEYTGTAWISYLKHNEPIRDSEKQYEAVAKEDMQKNDIEWLDRADLNNTYAIAATNEVAEEHQVKTLSDYAELENNQPEEATMCVANEFANRDDGLPGLEKAYDFDVTESNTATLQEGAIYNAIDKTNPCNYGEVFTTDGRIAALGLTVLEDDKQFFPIYNPAVTVRASVLNENPAIADVLNPIAAKLDTTTMQKLNAKVDVDGEPPEMVAEEWLTQQNLIEG